MRASRLIPALLAWLLLGAAPDPLGTGFQRLDHGRVTRAELPADTRRVAIYYGASWCGPCRAFVPELIAAYPRLRARGIEILFVSDDTTCAAALDYARSSRMPWLLLPCDAARRARLRKLGGEELPGIVVVDRAGVAIDSSWPPDGSSAPRMTLAKLLEWPGCGHSAPSRPRLRSPSDFPGPRLPAPLAQIAGGHCADSYLETTTESR